VSPMAARRTECGRSRGRRADGAAAKSLLGSDFRLTAHRGEVLHLPGDLASVHPSSILRGPPGQREEAFEALTRGLRLP
jgi:hypothetical protein